MTSQQASVTTSVEQQTVIPNAEQQTIISVIPKTVKNYSLIQSANNIVMISENQYNDVVFENFEQEKEYLKTWHIYGWAVSKDIAWELLYFGRHGNFLGLFYDVKANMKLFVPVRMRKQLGIDLPSIGNVIYKTRGSDENFESVVGAFGNGYACYGYTGAYLYCITWAIFCGVMSKLCVTYIFTDTHRIETTALGIFLLFVTPMIFCSSIPFVLVRLYGFIIIFLCELIVVKIITLICSVQFNIISNK
jgi:hypothetical protein